MLKTREGPTEEDPLGEKEDVPGEPETGKPSMEEG